MVGNIARTCPGISKFIRPIPEYFPCPTCGGEVEVWSDEDIGVCMKCGKKVSRPEKISSCLDWCPQAEKCKTTIIRTKILK